MMTNAEINHLHRMQRRDYAIAQFSAGVLTEAQFWQQMRILGSSLDVIRMMIDRYQPKENKCLNVNE